MSNDLYFISRFIRAFDAQDRAKALQDGFRAIRRMGERPAYEDGFSQYNAFMEEVARQASLKGRDVPDDAAVAVDAVIIGLATDTFEGDEADKEALLSLISSRPDWRDKYEAVRADLEREDIPPAPLQIVVTRDEVETQSLSFARAVATRTLTGVLPGRYTLKLSTGRVIWEEVLKKEDLEWAVAFPGRALDLAAADPETPEGTPTREIRLLGGEVVVLVFPGLEAGVMKITVNG